MSHSYQVLFSKVFSRLGVGLSLLLLTAMATPALAQHQQEQQTRTLPDSYHAAQAVEDQAAPVAPNVMQAQVGVSKNAASAAAGSLAASAFALTNTPGDTLFVVDEDGAARLGPAGFDLNFGEMKSWGYREGLYVDVYSTDGHPSAGWFTVHNPASQAVALGISQKGNGAALSAWSEGTGSAGSFRMTNPDADFAAVYARHDGIGSAVYATNPGVGNGLTARTGGGTESFAGLFLSDNADNTYPALQADVAGSGSAVRGFSNGTGPGGDFFVTNAANESPALYVETVGIGNVATFIHRNVDDNSPSVYAEHQGLGSPVEARIWNTTNPFSAVFATTDGTGSAMRGQTYGSGTTIVASAQGSGFPFQANQSGDHDIIAAFSTNWEWKANIDTTGTGNFAALNATQEGDAPAVQGVMNGPNGRAGRFAIDNVDNANTALVTVTQGLGQGAFILNSNTANTQPVLSLRHDGAGAVLKANHNGTAGDVATFLANGTNVARIDRNGTGFFNGGTQNSGADLAEAFAVEGFKAAYEPGDVLVISLETDRTVTRSAEPYSTLLAGVYATKPGVLLHEDDMAETLDETVPMGVVGVIPTKVSGENGPIRRGDLLVTSSTPGHAMRADRERLGFGMVLGKALENFDGQGTSTIKVLVNVK